MNDRSANTVRELVLAAVASKQQRPSQHATMVNKEFILGFAAIEAALCTMKYDAVRIMVGSAFDRIMEMVASDTVRAVLMAAAHVNRVNQLDVKKNTARVQATTFTARARTR